MYRLISCMKATPMCLQDRGFFFLLIVSNINGLENFPAQCCYYTVWPIRTFFSTFFLLKRQLLIPQKTSTRAATSYFLMLNFENPILKTVTYSGPLIGGVHEFFLLLRFGGHTVLSIGCMQNESVNLERLDTLRFKN